MKRNIKLFIIGIFLFVISLFVDKKVFGFIEIINNPILDIFMKWVTHPGSVFVVLIFMTTLFLWSERKKEWILPLWISSVASVLISFIIKFIIERQRPLFDIFIPFTTIKDYSFPSTHAMVAFSVLPILNREFPKFKWFWFLFAALVALSRVYTEVHYLSDVIFGAAIGYGIGCLIVHTEEKHKIFKKWTSSR